MVDLYHKRFDISYGGGSGAMDGRARMCVAVCVGMKGDRGSEWELGFDSQFPSRDKVSGNEALSCCAEETVGPPGEEDDLEDHEHTRTHTRMPQT